MRVQSLSAIVTLVLAGTAFAGLASGHLFNHQDRHEVCEIYAAPGYVYIEDPNLHSVNDGHEHWHHLDAAATGHYHGATYFPAGHTHADVFHDPCNQAGINTPDFFGAAGPLQEIPVADVVIANAIPGQTALMVKGEGYQFPGVNSLTEQTNLIVNGDAALGAMGFPGSGTQTDPYIIEGYLVRNIMMFKDTSKCMVIKNNVVHSLAVEGPLADPLDIVDNVAELELLEGLYEAAQALVDDLQSQLAFAEVGVELQEYFQAIEDATGAGLTAEQKQAIYDALDNDAAGKAVDILDLRDEFDAFREDFQAFLDDYYAEAPPEETYDEVSEDVDVVQDALGTFMETFNEYVEEAAPSSEELQETYDEYVGQLLDYEETLADLKDEREAVLEELGIASEDLEEATAAYDDAVELVNELASNYADIIQAYNDLQGDLADALGEEAALAILVTEMVETVADAAYEYFGFAFDDLTELVDFLIEEAVMTLDEGLAGRLILDWNAQCVHVYNNVVEDLRVNRNNDRTGYATGGILEDNRIFTIGQIRHYDGIVRENEIGDRALLEAILDGSTVDQPSSERSVNFDGFNEATMVDNIIYGHIDLDLHGHHHGAGFFTRESHYHGSDEYVGYMVDPQGNFLTFANGDRIPHHDHAKRWTSVAFADNVVIDPLGYGIRYEDRNHEGDDRDANSENMDELKRPHFHETFIEIENNVVMGSIWVDVFNADGIDLWSDDWSEVETGNTLSETLEAIQHFGATIENSHQERNNGWVDIVDNTIYLYDKDHGTQGAHYGWSAIQINNAKEMDLLAITGNKAFVVPNDFASGITEASVFLEFLEDGASANPVVTQSTLDSWYTGNDGMGTTIGILMKTISDSTILVCGNSVQGFDEGMRATQRIYVNTGITTCSNNDWGGSNPQVAVSFTPLPPADTGITDPLREIIHGIDPRLDPVTDPALDDVDDQGEPFEDEVDDPEDTADEVVDEVIDTLQDVVDDL